MFPSSNLQLWTLELRIGLCKRTIDYCSLIFLKQHSFFLYRISFVYLSHPRARKPLVNVQQFSQNVIHHEIYPRSIDHIFKIHCKQNYLPSIFIKKSLLVNLLCLFYCHFTKGYTQKAWQYGICLDDLSIKHEKVLSLRSFFWVFRSVLGCRVVSFSKL